MERFLTVLGLGGLIAIGGPILMVVLSILGIMWSAFFSLIVAIPVYFLWNWLMPELFALPVLAYWQAWGIVFLLALLVKGGSGFSVSNSKN